MTAGLRHGHLNIMLLDEDAHSTVEVMTPDRARSFAYDLLRRAYDIDGTQKPVLPTTVICRRCNNPWPQDPAHPGYADLHDCTVRATEFTLTGRWKQP